MAGALLGFLCTSQAEPLRVVLVGDSTMAPHHGYGDALCARLQTDVACLNLAKNGRSSGSYRAEGLWDAMLARLREPRPAPGTLTLLLIQFGHNDQPGKPGRSTDLATEFPANMARYVAEAQAAGATPVLLTPLTRRSFRGGVLDNDLRPWAEATMRVAAAGKVPLLDLNASSAAAVQAMGETEADTLATAAPGQPGFDRTHLGPKGACTFARLVEQGLQGLLPELTARFRPDGPCDHR